MGEYIRYWMDIRVKKLCFEMLGYWHRLHGRAIMRRFVIAAVMGIACCWGAYSGDAVEDVVRVPILDGIYSVDAPGDWHLEISGDDFTATFSEKPGADGTLVIAPPNPVVDDVKEYTQMSIEGLFNAFDNGEIIEESEKKLGRYPSYTATFSFKSRDSAFKGWARTVELDGYAVQAIMVVSAGKFDTFAETARSIANSYELDVDEADAFLPELKRIGRRSYDELEKNLIKKKEEREAAKSDN